MELQLKSLPQDMLSLIVAKVGALSHIDYVNTILTSKTLNITFHDFFVAKELNRGPLLKKPLLAKKYQAFMDNCLKANNLDAHYIKGIIEYFDSKTQLLGLHHLNIASKGGHKEGRYIYGVILIALGMIEKGKKILTKITNKVEITIVESCWESIQISWENIKLDMKKVYLESLETMQPQPNCHPQEINTVCSKCFHYYFMSEFVEMLIGLNPTPLAIMKA